ncbi:MAG: hypothetical protein V7739_22260 [Motiliproteus sp.]
MRKVILKSLMGTVILLLYVHSAASRDLGEEAYNILLSSYNYDVTYPLNARTAGTFKSNGIEFERIVFDSFHDGSVPGLLSVPTTGKKPYPVVLLLHGLTSSKSAWLENGFSYGSLLTADLLKNGYAVLALDA